MVDEMFMKLLNSAAESCVTSTAAIVTRFSHERDGWMDGWMSRKLNLAKVKRRSSSANTRFHRRDFAFYRFFAGEWNTVIIGKMKI